MTFLDAIRTCKDYLVSNGGSGGTDRISIWHKDEHGANYCYYSWIDSETDFYVDCDDEGKWESELFFFQEGKKPTMRQMLSNEWQVKVFKSEVITYSNFSGGKKYDF